MIVLKPKLTARALTREKFGEIVGMSVPRDSSYMLGFNVKRYFYTDRFFVEYRPANGGGEIVMDDLEHRADSMDHWAPGYYSLKGRRERLLVDIRRYRHMRRLVREFASYGYTEMD